MIRKVRLDLLLVEKGLLPSRARAQAMILAGRVQWEGRVVDKPGMAVPLEAVLTVTGDDCPWVSRGGLKLQAAVEAWGLDPTGLVCLDAGASTGGFTDLLVTRGALRVYAVDVGYGQLAWKLRQDPRVIQLERTHLLRLTREQIPEAVDWLVADLSFISLTRVLPYLTSFLKPVAKGVVLVKPQFEVGRGQVGKGGVVRDPALHRFALDKVILAARALGWEVVGEIPSPILGPAGNREFLLHLVRDSGGENGSDPDLPGGDVLLS